MATERTTRMKNQTTTPITIQMTTQMTKPDENLDDDTRRQPRYIQTTTKMKTFLKKPDDNTK
jgi:hypothetical protein